jgi:hypothetical protein
MNSPYLNSPYLTDEISVKYPSGSVKAFSSPIKIHTIMNVLEFKKDQFPIVGAVINNELRGLNELYELNVELVEPVYLNSLDGQELYDVHLS